MNTTTNSLVQKLWNYCNVLRDDGMSYGDYVEQLTFLLFLKMADERSAPPYNQASIVPAAYAWPTLLAQDGDALFDHYRHALEKLGQEKGTLGLIFGKAQNKFQDPAKLRRVIVDLIDAETWTILGADVKGDAYEGLLEKTKFQRRLTCTQVTPELKTRKTPRAAPANTSRRVR
ncbi:type I restriction-modification system subunit M N-terminal domain-containing protein [Rhodoferax sp.]|uniref:type I restriction-modification system subunit M N-terminal domain-containing protein n=1 Tax=Rhodoferax sp. TaxID=50421 RepID=UPI0025E42E62|nr:type I restriction-modification system subunit M N-terminal domain-containing protein [Rhodoferax sp.]